MTNVQHFLEQDLVFKEKPKSGRFQDIEGQKFGRLTVVGFVEINKNKNAVWYCKCDCGNPKTVAAYRLKNGNVKSCGCFKIQRIKEANTTHGHTVGRNVSRIYNIWGGMMQRCYDKSSKHYPNYGGRGITVCESWHTFENFLTDMGEPLPGMSIDRIENSGNYCPENCKWATAKEQQNNRRCNVILIFNGKSQTMAQWLDETGIPYETLRYRLKKGWPIERALTK